MKRKMYDKLLKWKQLRGGMPQAVQNIVYLPLYMTPLL